MAKKQQILLENIFDAACVIEEAANNKEKKGPRPPGPPKGSGLLGAGLLGGLAGAGAYAIRDKLGDTAEEAGEHINSLRDKLANIIATHHDENEA
jgi:uncharacterized protein involved in exopolysaccharide biosynthesis